MATGIDEILAEILKAAAPAIAEPLTRVFNMSIVSEKFLMEWKVAQVTPIFEKGQRSMLAVVSKVVEIKGFCTIRRLNNT